MAQKDYFQHDFSKVPVLGLVVESSSSAPASPVSGQLWNDTSATPSLLKVYNATTTTWDLVQNAASTVTSAMIVDGTIVNADVNASAAIARSKLDFGTGLVNADIAAAAGIVTSKIASFDTQVQTSRLDQMALPTADLNANSHKITNVTDPVNPQDASTKAYTDQARAGIAGVKDPVKVSLTANVTLSGPGATLDGITMAAGDRFLATAQTTTTENGIYVWNSAAGAATRATDADGTSAQAEIQDGTLVAVAQGTNAGKQYIQTATPSGNIGAWTQTWTVISTGGSTYVGGAGLTLTGNTFDVVAADGSLTVNADNMTVGNVPISKGGTGQTTAAAALTALGGTKSATGTLGAVTGGTALAVTHGLTLATAGAAMVQFFDRTSHKTVGLQYSVADTGGTASTTVFSVYSDVNITTTTVDWVLIGQV